MGPPWAPRRRSAAQRALTQQVIGEHDRHHRLADRHGADADAGVVPALGADLDLLAVDVDGAARRQDRAGRLDGEAEDDVLTGRDAAEHATCLIREEVDLIPRHAHLIGVILAGELGGSEARADLHTLDRVDAHHRLGEIGVELVVDGIAEAGGNAARHHLDDGAGRGAALPHLVEEAFPDLHRLAVGRPEGIVVDRVPIPARAVDAVGAHLDQRATDGDTGSQDLARDRAGGDAGRGLARRGAAAAAMVADAVFLPIGVVGMAGAEAVLDRLVILGARILVLDHQRNRRAGGAPLEDAGKDADAVALAPLGRKARLAGAPPVEPVLDVALGELDQRRRAVDHAADGRPMAFTPGGEAEEAAEAVAGHGPYTTDMSGASTAFMPTTW